MIIKKRDSRKDDIKKLEKLLSSYNLSAKQKFLIEREIYTIKKGEAGEKDSSYYIDFYYGDSKNWTVIHDLRIEFNGKVAQIDHILINRFFDIYVLESKNYNYNLRITELGEFEIKYKNNYIGISSPIEQNKRHIDLLSKFIEAKNILPKRVGINIQPRFFNYILISPKAIIRRPKSKKFNFSNVIKADMLPSVIMKNSEEINTLDVFKSILKISSFSTVEKFAKELIAYHKPAKIDWIKKFGIKNTKKYYCFKCGVTISEKEAKFCWNNRNKFKGKAFCFKCQKELSKNLASATAI